MANLFQIKIKAGTVKQLDLVNQFGSRIFANQRIAEFNTEIQTMCQENQLSFLDLNPEFIDETGNLPQNSTEDGIHFTAEFCKKYLETILQ